LYIVIDGIDGTGKSSLISNISVELRKTGYVPVNLVEPSYGKYGQLVRKQLGSANKRDLVSERELFTSDRADHVKRTIQPLIDLSKNHQHS